MADEQDIPQEQAGDEVAVEEKPSYPPITADSPWSQVWQLPVLLLGLGLLALGVWAVLPSKDAPDMDGLLDSAAMFIKANNLETAAEKLETAKEHLELATPAQTGRVWALYGDLNFMQLNAGLDAQRIIFEEPENVLEARRNTVSYYRQAEDNETGYRLSNQQIGRLAQMLVSLDRDDEALALLDRLADAEPKARYQIIRRMIERKLVAEDGVDQPQLLSLFEKFESEVRQEANPAAQTEQKVWVITEKAKLWLDAAPGEAERFLTKNILRLRSEQVSDDVLGPLFVILARAQAAQELYDKAIDNFKHASNKLSKDHALQADVMVGVARIGVARGPDEAGLREALALYKRAVDQFPSEPAYIDALIGKADVESRLGQHNMARKTFTLAVEALQEHTPAWDPRRLELEQVVLAHAQHASEQGAHERSLSLLTQLLPLHKPHPPASLLFKFGETHERMAQQHHDSAHGINAPQPSPDARKLHNQEAAIHFGKSAEYFWQYAGLKTRADDRAHGDALWRAAQNFDRAQLWEDAVKVYQQFVAVRTEDHRLLQAKHLLGKAQMAHGDYPSAIKHFAELRRDHPKGRWTYESMVPMARSYAATDQFAAARKLLLEATQGHPGITPDSAIYRDALIELGRIHYEAGSKDATHFVRAIETLTEAVKRFGNTDEGPALRYMLADANRRSIVTIEAKLKERRAQRELIALQAERLRRLEEAQIYFNQVITELEGRPSDQRSPLQATYLRNAYFFQADCAFDRGQYEQAIALYDEAAKRWESHPASLVAHVQIVNAYCELGQYDSAKRANEKALWQLERLPDEAFNDPTLPMTRRHWEDWLRWTSEIDLFGAQARAR